MKATRLLAAAMFLILTSAAWASGISDTTPPQLASIAVSPTVIDTSTNSQTLLVTVRLTDDLSGITLPEPILPSRAGATAYFRNAAGDIDSPVLILAFAPSMRVSGDEFDGVYTNVLTVPRFSRAGNWMLFQFAVVDAVGNQKQMGLAELRELGFSTGFTVQGIDDFNPPDIVSAQISPATVDTSISNQPITITVRLSDDSAGMDQPSGMASYSVSQINFVSPSKGQYTGSYFTKDQRVSGDQYDGVYTNTAWLPRYSEPGTWTVDSVLVVDAAGNQRRLDLAGVLDRGLPSGFTVQGTGDTTPPQIRAFDFFPRRIDTSSSNQTITFTARLSDALSGMSNSVLYYASWGQASVTFVSPSKHQAAGGYFNARMRSSGSDFDGIYTNTMVLPRFSETGVWTLQGLNLADAAGNSTALEAADLRALGLPTQFAVGIAPSLTIRRQGDSILLSWPAWASGFALEAQGGLEPLSAWVPVGIKPAVYGEEVVVAFPLSGARTFYRLSEQP